MPGDEILLDRAGAAIAEREVVFGGAALIAVAFDRDANLRISCAGSRGLASAGRAFSADIGLVEIEIGVR